MKTILRGAAVIWLAGAAMAPALADEAKLEACRKTPTHACVLDLLWDEMPRVGRDYQAETKRAFIDAALLTGDKALIDLYMERTEWRNADALNSSYIGVARQKGDRDTLVEHGDKAIRGLRYDWYQLSTIANGLAEVGEIEKARKVADLIPHGPDDSVTTLNLHTFAQEVIGFHDPAPVSLANWADRIATDDGWFEEADQAWLKSAAARAGDLSAFPQELQERYRADGWKYLRAIARLAPQMTASGDAAAPLFRAYVEGWADPRNDSIAELVLVIAARAHPGVRAAMLAAFDARQPMPPPRIARIRNAVETPDAPLIASDRGLLGLTGGSFEQRMAARALATHARKEFLEAARAGEGDFSLSGPRVLRAALEQAPDPVFALDIAKLMAELGEPRTIDGYDYARYATEWAMNNCERDLFKLAESRLARPDSLDTMIWNARFDRDPVSIVEFVSFDDRITSEISSLLGGYQAIIAKGYCPA